MYQARQHSLFQLILSLLLSGVLLQSAFPSVSQAAFTSAITPDGTLGTTVTPSGHTFNINGGTIKGTNQFHSLGLFSVGTGDIASFNGPSSIANILSRVTGGQQSMIDGTLRSTVQGANLYLMNPAGVLFGRNASLDLSGAFHVTTADYLRLSDNVQFLAKPDLAKDSVLTTTPVAAFGFIAPQPVGISVQRSVLQAPAGQTLSLIGGDIAFQGDPILGYLAAPGGRVHLVSVGSPGEVTLTGSPPDVNVDSFNSLGKIDVTEVAFIDAGGARGGTILIRGGTLTVDNSFVSADTSGSTDGARLALDIKVAGDITFRNGAEAFAFAHGAGRGGDVLIAGQNVQLDSSSDIRTASLGPGQGGKLDVQAKTIRASNNSEIAVVATSSGASGNLTVTADSIVLDNPHPDNTSAVFGGLRAETLQASSGQGGSVVINTKTLEIRDGAILNVSTRGRGHSGDLTMRAEQIFLTDGGSIYLQSGLGSLGGRGGNLSISAQKLQIENGGTISAKSRGGGKAGDFEITAKEIILKGEGFGFDEFSPSAQGFIPSSIRNNPSSTGPGGNITIHADRMEILDGGQVGVQVAGSVFNRTTGTGGSLNFDVKEVLVLSGISKSTSISDSGRPATITSSTQTPGRGGSIQIVTPTLEVKNGARITSDAGAEADGGSIVIKSDKVLVSGAGDIQGGIPVDTLLRNSSAISARTSTSGTGKGGNVNITAKELEVSDGGVITLEVRNGGQGGDLTVNADHVLLQETTPLSDFDRTLGTGLRANAFAGQGNGGNITINAKTLEILNGANIITITNSLGNAGSVSIQAEHVVLARTLDLVDRTFPDGQTQKIGLGGSIRTDNLSGFPSSGGDIRIQADVLELKGGNLESGNFGPGKSGSIDVHTRVLTMEEAFGRFSRIGASTSPRGLVNGPAGSIAIVATERFSLGRNTSIESSTRGPGAGGEVAVSGGKLVIDSGVIEAKTTSTGEGGRITLKGDTIALINGAQISSNSEGGSGNAGNISINSANQFVMRDSSVTTQATQTDGGDITLQVGSLLHLINSDITTSVGTGAGNGGNISVDPQFFILDKSRIVANAFGGNGGNINITAGTFLASPDSVIDASSALGINGTVSIQAPVTNLSGTLAPLPQGFLQAAGLLAQRCAARMGGTSSTFVVAGREGLPLEPGGLLPSPLYEAGAVGIAAAVPVQEAPGAVGPVLERVLVAFHEPLLPAVLGSQRLVAKVLAQGCP